MGIRLKDTLDRMADANAWMEYIQQVLDKMNFNTGEYTKTGVCEAAAIYGQDGSAWAWSPNFPELQPQQVTIEGMTDADTKTVTVDEFNCALQAGKGNRNPGEGGIRMGNEKYMFVSHNDGLTQLSKKGGGASIYLTATAMIIAFFVKDKPMTHSNKEFQTAGGCSDQVLAMGNYLKDQGY